MSCNDSTLSKIYVFLSTLKFYISATVTYFKLDCHHPTFRSLLTPKRDSHSYGKFLKNNNKTKRKQGFLLFL